MERRVRSPNYPALSLPEAVEKAALIYKNQHSHGAPREVVAKSMGYNTLNGASATAISALIKYGLLEGRGDEIRISDRAMRILHPQSLEEKAAAVSEAANGPDLFKELAEKFPGRMPAEEVIRNYLIRRGFAPAALTPVILAYRETNEFVEREAGAYDSGQVTTVEAAPMQLTQTDANPATQRQPGVFANVLAAQAVAEGRSIGQYPFEGGGMLEIVVRGNIDTEEALDMAETLIDLKRKELERKKARAKAVREAANEMGLPDEDENTA